MDPSVKLYNVKKELDQKYSGYSRDDLLWILALYLPTNIQKANFSGDFSMYLKTFNDKSKSVARQLKDAGCKAIVKFDFEYLLEADGSGATLFTVTIDELPVMLKRVELDSRYYTFGVIYEGLVYKHFFKYMQENNITPNIAYFYDFKVCNTNAGTFSELYSEKMAGRTLFDELVQYQVNNREIPVTVWRSLLFQIIYTLICFQQLNLRHNDLHTGNIYINSEIKESIKYYVKPNVFYTVSLDNVGLIKIFDMDLASVDCTTSQLPNAKQLFTDFKADLTAYKFKTKHCDNPKSLEMAEYGIKPRGRAPFDLFVALCTILQGNAYRKGGNEKMMDSVTKNFINSVFSKADLDDPTMVFHCRSAKVNDNKTSYTKLRDLLKDPYFAPLKNVAAPDAVSFHLPSVKMSS